MRWMLAGGGTGGHLFPGLALADALRARCPEAGIGFIGTPDGLERTLVPRAGYPLDLIAAGRGSPISRHRPMNLPRFLVALAQCMRLLRKERPDALIVLGGYAGAAPGLVAGWLGIPLVLLEQNTIPGRVNRMLARRARQIHLQFLCAREHFGSSPATWHDTGSPIRAGLSALTRRAPCRGEALLVMGGSQGAQSLNALVLKAMPAIRDAIGCRVIHLCGTGQEESVGESYRQMGIEATVYGFCHQMETCYPNARLAVSRAGAGSLAELAAAGIPALLLPLPSAMDDHQRKNAEVLVRKGAACMLDEQNDAPATLAERVIHLWKTEGERAGMAEAIRRTARPDAAEEIANAILSLSPKGEART